MAMVSYFLLIYKSLFEMTNSLPNPDSTSDLENTKPHKLKEFRADLDDCHIPRGDGLTLVI